MTALLLYLATFAAVTVVALFLLALVLYVALVRTSRP